MDWNCTCHFSPSFRCQSNLQVKRGLEMGEACYSPAYIIGTSCGIRGMYCCWKQKSISHVAGVNHALVLCSSVTTLSTYPPDYCTRNCPISTACHTVRFIRQQANCEILIQVFELYIAKMVGEVQYCKHFQTLAVKCFSLSLTSQFFMKCFYSSLSCVIYSHVAVSLNSQFGSSVSYCSVLYGTEF